MKPIGPSKVLDLLAKILLVAVKESEPVADEAPTFRLLRSLIETFDPKKASSPAKSLPELTSMISPTAVRLAVVERVNAPS